MHIHRIQIHIKQVHIKQSLAKHRKGKECKSIEIEMMNGWGFALSPPYSLFLFSLFHISKFQTFVYGIHGYLPCLVPISVLVSLV